MGVIFKTDKRRIIPRWRSVELTAYTGELVNSRGNQEKPDYSLKNLEKLRQDWVTSKDIVKAGDLLSAAYSLGLESQFVDVADFVEKSSEILQPALVRLVDKVLGRKKAIGGISFSTIPSDDKSLHRDNIGEVRTLIKSENRNPLAWLELGRLYSLVGEVQKAQKCVDAALHLDKNNRYVVRSASRFYHHFHKDKSIALKIIRGSEFLKQDPWLLAADIAYCSILERQSVMAKLGVRMLENVDEGTMSVTELASALGTLELVNGKVKSAKRYINLSLGNPNDNSLAQATWLVDGIKGLTLDVLNSHVPLAFEAKSHEYYEREQYDKALEYSLLWLDDEPYSTRPVNLAAYISGIFRDDTAFAVELLRTGLDTNEFDPALTNNLSYFLVEEGKVDEAVKIFERNMTGINGFDINLRISVIATQGLLFFRKGYVERGREMYQLAIQLARKEGNSYLSSLATAYFIREELAVSGVGDGSLLRQLDASCKDREEPDVKKIYQKIIKKYILSGY